MNQQTFEQEIIQTLELCLTKMSEKLNSYFDPYDKINLQLLHQFRSTISTYHTCLKRAGKILNHSNKTKQPPKPERNQQSSQNGQSGKLSNLKQAIINKEKEIAHLLKQQKEKHQNLPAPKTNQSSGLLMTPV